MELPDIKEAVKEKYGQVALCVAAGCGCCGPNPCGAARPVFTETKKVQWRMLDGGV